MKGRQFTLYTIFLFSLKKQTKQVRGLRDSSQVLRGTTPSEMIWMEHIFVSKQKNYKRKKNNGDHLALSRYH